MFKCLTKAVQKHTGHIQEEMWTMYINMRNTEFYNEKSISTFVFKEAGGNCLITLCQKEPYVMVTEVIDKVSKIPEEKVLITTLNFIPTMMLCSEL